MLCKCHAMEKHDNILKPWLASERRSLKWLAEQIGVSPAHLSRVSCGVMPVTRHLALAIAKVTDDGVPIAQWGLR